ncbi:hypothetical protein IWZ03DRAFT_359420 [Phyllosticta citriasiana]|uniref:Uncharacterized protein n=1 Tax=Phyllosticta citriasiana TaxID=595635 RepID=A0ABR1KLC3_9PEZI
MDIPTGQPRAKAGNLTWISQVSGIQETSSLIPSSVAQKHSSGTSLELWEYSAEAIQYLKYILIIEKNLSRVRQLLCNTVKSHEESRYHKSANEDLKEVFNNLCSEKGMERDEIIAMSRSIGHVLSRQQGKKRKTEEEKEVTAAKRQLQSNKTPEHQQESQITAPARDIPEGTSLDVDRDIAYVDRREIAIRQAYLFGHHKRHEL